MSEKNWGGLVVIWIFLSTQNEIKAKIILKPLSSFLESFILFISLNLVRGLSLFSCLQGSQVWTNNRRELYPSIPCISSQSSVHIRE